MIKMICPYCEKESDVQIVKNREHYEKGATSFYYNAVHCKCAQCGQLFDSAQQMDSNLLAMRNAQQEQNDNISPEYITGLREKYNASQKAFGIILGMGPLTINSYEQKKSIPNTTNRLLLKLAEKPFIFFEMYNINKNKIGCIQRDRIESSEAYKEYVNLMNVKEFQEAFVLAK